MDQTSELPPSGTLAETKTPLKPEEIQLRSFFRGSFRYAQGSLAAQSFIAEWAFGSGKMPQMKIPREMPDYIKGLMPPGNHILSSTDQRDTDRQDAWDDLYRTSIETEFVDPSESLSGIMNEILRRELKYQLIGRKGRDQDQDMFDSYLRRYIVLGERTDSPILDDLSQELEVTLAELLEESTSQTTSQGLDSRETRELEDRFRKGGKNNLAKTEEIMTEMGSGKMLSLVMALWERNHRGEKFFPTPQT